MLQQHVSERESAAARQRHPISGCLDFHLRDRVLEVLLSEVLEVLLLELVLDPGQQRIAGSGDRQMAATHRQRQWQKITAKNITKATGAGQLNK